MAAPNRPFFEAGVVEGVAGIMLDNVVLSSCSSRSSPRVNVVRPLLRALAKVVVDSSSSIRVSSVCGRVRV